jgi:hypothetical protein
MQVRQGAHTNTVRTATTFGAGHRSVRVDGTVPYTLPDNFVLCSALKQAVDDEAVFAIRASASERLARWCAWVNIL